MAFRMCDLNDNGYISKSEFKSIVKSMETAGTLMELTPESGLLHVLCQQGDEVFSQVDKNGGGSISYKEFCKWLESQESGLDSPTIQKGFTNYVEEKGLIKQ